MNVKIVQIKKSNVSFVESFFTKKWLSTHNEREHHPSESNPNVLGKPTTTANSNRTLIVGASFSGESHLILKVCSRLSDPDVYIFTKSPPEQ